MSSMTYNGGPGEELFAQLSAQIWAERQDKITETYLHLVQECVARKLRADPWTVLRLATKWVDGV